MIYLSNVVAIAQPSRVIHQHIRKWPVACSLKYKWCKN